MKFSSFLTMALGITVPAGSGPAAGKEVINHLASIARHESPDTFHSALSKISKFSSSKSDSLSEISFHSSFDKFSRRFPPSPSISDLSDSSMSLYSARHSKNIPESDFRRWDAGAASDAMFPSTVVSKATSLDASTAGSQHMVNSGSLPNLKHIDGPLKPQRRLTDRRIWKEKIHNDKVHLNNPEVIKNRWGHGAFDEKPVAIVRSLSTDSDQLTLKPLETFNGLESRKTENILGPKSPEHKRVKKLTSLEVLGMSKSVSDFSEVAPSRGHIDRESNVPDSMPLLKEKVLKEGIEKLKVSDVSRMPRTMPRRKAASEIATGSEAIAPQIAKSEIPQVAPETVKIEAIAPQIAKSEIPQVAPETVKTEAIKSQIAKSEIPQVAPETVKTEAITPQIAKSEIPQVAPETVKTEANAPQSQKFEVNRKTSPDINDIFSAKKTEDLPQKIPEIENPEESLSLPSSDTLRANDRLKIIAAAGLGGVVTGSGIAIATAN